MMMKIRYISILILMLLLAAGATACGGGSDPVNNDPGGQSNGGGASLIGRILDREGTPVGIPWTELILTVVGGSEISPAQQPPNSGPEAGQFQFLGLPTGIPMVLEIGMVQPALGRNLGWIQQITLTSGGTFDLGDIVLENDFLDNGWSAYVSKEYSLALLNFNRAVNDRYIQSNLSYSSSAYTGIGWVYAKRGKDNTTGLYYTDDTGAWLDTINSYEWDQALSNFDTAIANPNDSDAWVGMGGTYLTLVGRSNKNPVLVGPEIPFYTFLEFYFDDAEEALERALLVDPNYTCSHDKISTDDIQATLLFLRWVQGHPVTIDEVNALNQSGDLNQGSLQLLSVMPDLINYNPYPQL
jgi:tetratricopeptide (TPR) repeat protein